MDNFFQNTSKHKFWLLAGIFCLFILILIYPYSPYESIRLDITRTQAINLAKGFLAEQNVDTKSYRAEGFVLETYSETNYLLKKLGTRDFKKIINSNSLPIYGWNIRFYKNTSQDESVTLYSVNISYSGKIIGFQRTIPDTISLPSVPVDEGRNKIIKFINKISDIDLAQFNLTGSKVDNLGKRKDFTFIWERKIPNLNYRLIIRASIQGNQPGSFFYSIEIPPQEKNILETGQAILFTISVIFIFFLTQFAIFLFLKKYHEGEVWVNVGKNLFIIFFVVSWIGLLNSWPTIGQGVQIGSLDLLMTKLIVFASMGFLVYFFLSLLVFSSWSVGESYAREYWPEKLRGADAFIKGRVFSIPSGFSLIRGMIIGLAISLIYVVLSIIFDVKNSSLIIGMSNYLNIYFGFSPTVDLFIYAFIYTILSGVSLTFFIISITYNRWKKKWITILFSGAISAVGTVVAANTLPFNILYINVIFTFILGCFSAYIFFRYDLLTLLSIQYHVFLIMNGLILYRGNTSYYQWNFGFLVAGLLIVPSIYIISRIRKTNFALDNFGLPSHIKKISERERLKKELEIAAKVQLSLLPKEQPKLDGYKVTSISIPAKEAGGDYYDFVKLTTDKLGIAVGDVSGKGIGAAIYMTLTKGIFQAHADEDATPSYVLSKVNKLLYKTIEKNSFVSMIYAILDVHNHTLTYSRAGHNPGIFINSVNCTTQLLRSDGIALGLDAGSIFSKVLVEEQISINPNDIIVFYTDGFVEAMNEKLEEYGENRLIDIIKNNYLKSPKELLNLIVKDLKKFIDIFPQHDDMTMVILKRDDD